jgi:hypothetical protein
MAHHRPPDACQRCDLKARCVESRTGPAYRRRRYRCPACGAAWTTREVVVSEGPLPKGYLRHWTTGEVVVTEAGVWA